LGVGLSAYFALNLDMGLAGAWYGTCIAGYLGIFIFGYIVYRVDLDKEFENIRKAIQE